MRNEADEKSLAATLAKLRANHAALPWRERRNLAQSLAQHLANDRCPDSVLPLLDLLSADPKWEVRGDVAELLLLVPDERFPQLVARLSEDSNSFVRKAAERALDRRRKGEQDARRKRRDVEDLADDYAMMETLHGTLAAQKAREIGERLYDVLVGAAVHNMRRVLTTIKHKTISLFDHPGKTDINDPIVREHLNRIRESVEFLERLMNDMLAYSQPVPQERHRERLIDLISDAFGSWPISVKLASTIFCAINLEISVSETITLDVARHQIVVSFTNMMQNAFEAFVPILKEGRECRVSVAAKLTDDDQVEIVIEDNGIGFGEADLKRIREFIPGHTSLKSHGTGFGLPTAKRYIEGHGGRIGIDSSEDEGTRVTITLPIESDVEESGE